MDDLNTHTSFLNHPQHLRRHPLSPLNASFHSDLLIVAHIQGNDQQGAGLVMLT